MRMKLYLVIRSGQYAVPDEAGGGYAGKTVIVAARIDKEEADKIFQSAITITGDDADWGVNAVYVDVVEIDAPPVWK